MKLRLTRKADADIANILRNTRKHFGRNQVLAYASIIDDGLWMIAIDPSRPACRRQEDLGPGVQSMHLDHVRGKSGSAAHLVFFVQRDRPDSEREIVVIGVLHERMLPRRHLARVLREMGEIGSADE